MSDKITYDNKTFVNPIVNAVQQWLSQDANEIKTKFNDLVDRTAALETSSASFISGYQGSLAIADTPSTDGYYVASEEGTYTNAGSVVSDFALGVNIILVDNTQTSFDIIQIPLSSANTANYKIIPSDFDWTTIGAPYANCILEIKYDFDLAAQTINLPADVVLKFTGGSFSNGTLNGAATAISAPLYTIFDPSLTLGGTWDIEGWVYSDWFGFDKTGATDDTALWTKLEEFSEGKTVYVTTGTYVKNRTFPKSNTTFVFSPDVVVNVVTGVSGNNSWRLSLVDNVHFYGNGCTFNKDSTGGSANFYFEGATNCSINNVKVVGAAPLKDNIYVGEGSGTICENIVIDGCICENALRNGISVVAVDGCIITNCDIYGATGAPGAGIDVEANEYDKIFNVQIFRNKVHNNQENGIVNVFGNDVKIFENDVYDNGNSGIAMGAGGTQFERVAWGNGNDVARPQDFMPVSNFSTADGWITIQDSSNLAGNYIPLGTIIQFKTRNGATLPTELDAIVPPRWVVEELDSAGNDRIRVAQQFGYNKQTSFAGAGTGTLTTNIDTTDVGVLVYGREGQSSGIDVYDNFIYNNGLTNAGQGQLSISTSVDVRVARNTITPPADVVGVNITYSKDISLERNRIELDINSTILGNSNGINSGTCSFISLERNKILNAYRNGIRITGGSGTELSYNKLVDCGSGADSAMYITQAYGLRCIGNNIKNIAKQNVSKGIEAIAGNVTNSLFTLNDCYRAGDSNANSILAGGAGNVKVNNILFDGTIS